MSNGVKMVKTTTTSTTTELYYKMQVSHFTEFAFIEIDDEDSYVNLAIFTSVGSILIVIFMAAICNIINWNLLFC